VTPAKTSTTFEHDGITYTVYDWKYHGVQRRRVDLNSRHAEGRAFVPPRESGKGPRVFLFRGFSYYKSDPATLAQQFAASVPASWND
jgi:hypothetical protein